MEEAADDLSPREFREWLQDWHRNELVRIRKTADAQSTDATAIVTDYVGGKLTQDQAHDRWVEYLDRWGEPQFEGSPDLDKMNNSQVIKLAERIRGERLRAIGL